MPPLPEQKKIAAILSSVDEAIQATQAVINQIRRVKEGLLQDLLTRGLPGHTRFKQTEIGEIPETWEVRRLENCASINVGHVGGTSDHYVPDGILFLRTGNLSAGRVVMNDVRFVTRPFHESLRKSSLRPGDVLVSRVGYTGGAAVVPDDFPESNCANIIIIRPSVDLDSVFLRSFLNGPTASRINAGLSAGSAQAVLNIGAIKKVLLPVPPPAEQRIIRDFALQMDDLQDRLSDENSRLAKLKAGLLQDLLTGRVRVTP